LGYALSHIQSTYQVNARIIVRSLVPTHQWQGCRVLHHMLSKAEGNSSISLHRERIPQRYLRCLLVTVVAQSLTVGPNGQLIDVQRLIKELAAVVGHQRVLLDC